MKFTHFVVVRVGKHLTLRVTADWEKATGQSMEINFDAATMELAVAFEAMFQRLILAATAFEDVSDEVLQATLNLSKGRQDEHD